MCSMNPPVTLSAVEMRVSLVTAKQKARMRYKEVRQKYKRNVVCFDILTDRNM